MPTAAAVLLEIPGGSTRWLGIGISHPKTLLCLARLREARQGSATEESMIKSFAQLLGAASSSRLDALSRQVADQSVEDVCSAVRGQVEAMSFSEARGYVRARATRAVRKQARLVISQQAGGNESWVEPLTRMAIERLVPQVLRQTGVGVPTSIPQIRLAA